MCRLILIPDSSVLINLDGLGCFSHFERLRTRRNWKVLVPAEVLKELRADLAERITSVVSTISPTQDIAQLRSQYPQLGDGELGMLSAALQMKRNNIDTVLVLDDKQARKVARNLGLSFFGTVKLLFIMYQSNELAESELFALFQRLRQLGFWFDESVIADVLSGKADTHTIL